MATEILNDALFYQSYEIIGGEKIMAPAANLKHNGIIGRLFMFIGTYLDVNDKGYCFSDSADVHFHDGSLYKPDFSVVLKEHEQILNWDGSIYGTPDMVVEILSYSTRLNDLTIKKDTYEANGVREYWIVDPWMRGVDVYLLRDGKYELDGEYILFDEKLYAKDLEWLTNAGKLDQIKHEVPVSILDGLKVPLKYIFKWGY